MGRSRKVLVFMGLILASYAVALAFAVALHMLIR